MRLRLQAFINNEFRVSVQSDNPKRKKMSDTPSIKRNAKYATAIEKVQHLDKCLAKLLEESPDQVRHKNVEGLQMSLFDKPSEVGVSYSVSSVLPKRYKCLSELPDGRFVVSNRSTDELLRERQRHLDIISESQGTDSKHSSYGEKQSPKQFTKTARHRLLEAGAAVDLLGLKDSSSLLTLTLPGGTYEAKDALARWSGWIVNRQTQRLRDDSRFKDVYWFFVWEWQGRGALHQHWCVSAPTYEIAKDASMALKSAWYICLDEIGYNEGIDMYMRAGYMHSWKSYPKMWVWDEQKVKKSVGSYFAKYASKQSTAKTEKSDLATRKMYFPSRWFGSSRSIKSVCKDYRLDFSLHNITKVEAGRLSDFLIAELESYSITQRFNYEFEAIIKSNKSRVSYCKETDKRTGELSCNYELTAKRETLETVACFGRTEILYISPTEFVGCFRSLADWVCPFDSGIFPRSALHWQLQFSREKMIPQDALGSEGYLKYGSLVLFS
jgi:hypothetical protein